LHALCALHATALCMLQLSNLKNEQAKPSQLACYLDSLVSFLPQTIRDKCLTPSPNSMS
jgi:hypothetical protein